MNDLSTIDAYGTLTEPATLHHPAPAARPGRAHLGLPHRERPPPPLARLRRDDARGRRALRVRLARRRAHRPAGHPPRRHGPRAPHDLAHHRTRPAPPPRLHLAGQRRRLHRARAAGRQGAAHGHPPPPSRTAPPCSASAPAGTPTSTSSKSAPAAPTRRRRSGTAGAASAPTTTAGSPPDAPAVPAPRAGTPAAMAFDNIPTGRYVPPFASGAAAMHVPYRWVMVFLGGLMGCVAIGAMFSLAVFLDPMSAETGWSRAGISTAMTIDFLIMGVAGFLWGTLSDRYGPRPVVLIGAVLLGAGLARRQPRHHAAHLPARLRPPRRPLRRRLLRADDRRRHRLVRHRPRPRRQPRLRRHGHGADDLHAAGRLADRDLRLAHRHGHHGRHRLGPAHPRRLLRPHRPRRRRRPPPPSPARPTPAAPCARRSSSSSPAPSSSAAPRIPARSSTC